MTELLTPQEAAKRLGHSYGSLAVWRCKNRKKGLPFVRLGRKIFYRPEDIEKFILANVNSCEGPQPTPKRK